MSSMPHPAPASKPAPGGARTLLLSATLIMGALASGCVSVPPPLQGAWSPLVPREASEANLGAAVRWGGRIVAVDSEGERTCFRLIAQPLAPNGQPDGSDTSLGRFSACRVGNYDARSFAPNREITITGRIEGFDEAPAGGEARTPRLAAQAIVLWPHRR